MIHNIIQVGITRLSRQLIRHILLLPATDHLDVFLGRSLRKGLLHEEGFTRLVMLVRHVEVGGGRQVKKGETGGVWGKVGEVGEFEVVSFVGKSGRQVLQELRPTVLGRHWICFVKECVMYLSSLRRNRYSGGKLND